MADAIVDELLFTQFCDKGTIISKSLTLPYTKSGLAEELNKLQGLRDGLAHANDYAATSDEAREVCGMVRDLLAMRRDIEAAVIADTQMS